MSIGNKKEALIRAIKNSKCCCDKDSSEEQGGGTINFDELAEKAKNFYIYPKKDKARFFQDGVDGEYDASKQINSGYADIAEYYSISNESSITGTANVEDYFEVSDIEVFKLLAVVASHCIESYIPIRQTDSSKLLANDSTSGNYGIQSNGNLDKEVQDVLIFCWEFRDDTTTPYSPFGVVLTPEDYTKFYVVDALPS